MWGLRTGAAVNALVSVLCVAQSRDRARCGEKADVTHKSGFFFSFSEQQKTFYTERDGGAETATYTPRHKVYVRTRTPSWKKHNLVFSIIGKRRGPLHYDHQTQSECYIGTPDDTL